MAKLATWLSAQRRQSSINGAGQMPCGVEYQVWYERSVRFMTLGAIRNFPNLAEDGSLAAGGESPLPLHTSHYLTVASTEETRHRNFFQITAVLLSGPNRWNGKSALTNHPKYCWKILLHRSV